MVCLSINMGEDVEEIADSSDYVVKRKGGRSLIDKPPKFSPDETCIFVISGRGVQVYDVGTTQFVRSLEDKSDSSPIIGMGFLPNDDRTLVTCTETGNVVFWKWHAAVQSSKLTLNIPEDSRILSFDLVSHQKALIGFVHNSKAAAATVIFSGNKFTEVVLQKVESSIGPRWCMSVGWFGKNNIAALSEGTSFIHIFNVNKPTEYVCHSVSRNVAVTCLSWHPREDILAVGDTLGRVMLWRSPLLNPKPPREVKHWHHLPLAALSFSLIGGVLLTGGAERVMVAWGQGESKRFIPRLPAEILHIASSSSHIVISTADNSIQIVDGSSMYLTGCIREAGGLGSTRRKSDKNDGRIGPDLQYAHPTSSLILPAGPGHLHMYSVATDSLMYTLDVTNTNIVPPERDNLEPEQIEVTEMSVGCRGQWLCTWEGRGEQERLRWFSLVSGGEQGGRGWSLHTVVARPHRPSAPAALQSCQDAAMTVSYDTNCHLRFWSLVDSVPGHEGKAAWCTISQGQFSGGKAGGVALSGDGSVCAVWNGPRLTLWDTHRGRQKACLSHPALRPHGKLTQFGRDHHMHYLACTTDNSLGVWNTLSLRLVWIVQLQTTSLVADPFTDHVAAITNQNDVFIFRMSNSCPLVTLKEALPLQRGSITSAAFAPVKKHFRLYLLREQQEIFVVEHADVGNQDIEMLERLPVNSRPAPSAYGAMVAERNLSLVKARKRNSLTKIINTTPAINELLLSSASHAQPNVRTLCAPFLRIIAGSKKASYESQEPKKQDTDSDSEDKKIYVKNEKKERVKHFDSVKSVNRMEKESMEWAKSLFDSVKLET